MRKKFKLTPFAIALLAANLAFSSAQAQVKTDEPKPIELSMEQMLNLPLKVRLLYQKGELKIYHMEKLSGSHLTAYVGKINGKLGVFYADGDYTIFGNVLNTEGKNLTVQYLERFAVPVTYNLNNFKAKEIKYGHGKKEVVVFTDPMCPHCIKRVLVALKKDKTLQDKYTFRFVMVGFVTPISDEMAEFILKETDKGIPLPDAWEKALKMKDKFHDQGKVPVIKENSQNAANAGINQVPTVLRKDKKTGKWVEDKSIF
ncbi:thioredoxin domain-containing protein [Galenea microaerophila]